MATRRRASKSTLTGNITDLQRRVRYLQAKPVPSKLANQVVTRTAIQPRAVSTDQIALNAIANDQIQADAIRQEQLANLSVGNPELQDNAVLNRNINQDAVTAESIAINAVGSSEIADNAVGSGEIADNAVGSGEIADSAVGSSEIAMDAVTSNEIAPGAVDTNELASGAVTTDKIDSRAVTGDKIALNTIQKNNIAPDAVGASELADSAVTAPKIADSAVTSNKLATNAVTAAKIEARAVTTAKIADNAVTAGQIGSSTRAFITRSHVFVGTGMLASRDDAGITLRVAFGAGSTQVPIGNHTHTVSNVAAGGATRTTSTPSTVKLKKDIQLYKPANIKNLLKLEPKTYKYKRSERAYHQALNKEVMYGYIVEELLDLGFSEPVGYDKEGSPATLDYGLMSLLVLELVKVQQTEIDSLKEEVLRLKDAK
jgi:hypothetical protein